jgi:peptide chain release factor 1
MNYDKNLFAALQKIREKFNELNEGVNNEHTSIEQYKQINKQISKFAPIVKFFDEYEKLINNANQAEILSSKNDDLAEIAKLEINEAHIQIPKLELKLKLLLTPTDPNDKKNVLIEMRPAAGGDESSIFVSDLFSAYQKYISNQG